jgi:hypothetical protein
LGEIIRVEQILQPIKDLHRRLPAHVGLEHPVQNRLRSWSQFGSLLFAIPMPQTVRNDVSWRVRYRVNAFGSFSLLASAIRSGVLIRSIRVV